MGGGRGTGSCCPENGELGEVVYLDGDGVPDAVDNPSERYPFTVGYAVIGYCQVAVVNPGDCDKMKRNLYRRTEMSAGRAELIHR